MVFRRYELNLALRVLLLAASIFLFVYLILRTSFYITTTVVGAGIAYQTYLIIRLTTRTNRDIARFLEAITYDDFSRTSSGPDLGPSFRELRGAFRNVLEKFQETRAEKEEQYRFLQTVIQHIGIALISFDSQGEVNLINKSAKQLLNVLSLKNIRSLEGWSREFVDTLLTISSGERALVKVEVADETLQLSVNATEFITREENYTLVTIHNIHTELEEKEMEAWQTLIRVLTHEIMNSVTPIASLASTVHDLLPQLEDLRYDTDGSEESDLEDIRSAVHTIQKRSEGLLHFVESYRKLTRLPQPHFTVVSASSLLERTHQLMEKQAGEARVHLSVHVKPESLEITADPEMIEQVLINLVLNAIQSLAGNPDGRVSLRAGMDDRGQVMLQVIDNGPGILEEVQEKIFIPFFTTKQDGTGIGLSLARQIMRAHGGTIGVRSRPGEETVFTLRF